ncbi:MAG: sodium-dependent transporter [Oligoflexia bacterium]|nr:MAG: sodium-dependent transporter [Oligoflexia bacterium]
MGKRLSWATRFGFYLAAIGSACGLGNLWRFPYVVGENGGGAFVLLYVFLALTFGLPLLIGELILGKATRKSVLTAVDTLEYEKKKPFRIFGKMALVLNLAVLSYYAVISGWVLHFAIQFLVRLLGIHQAQTQSMMDLLLNNGLLQVGLTSVHLLFTIIVVLKGIQDGLEKWVGWMMPLFGVLMLILVVRSLSLSSNQEALRFLFYPDFSKLTYSSMIHAIGHVCFTLSVGFGTMVTFGSYLREEDHVPTAGFRVTIVDTLISLFAGLLIFPIAFQGTNTPMTDPGLLFELLPSFLFELPGGILFGFGFFICLYLAALSASIGLLEVIVSNIEDRLKYRRSSSAWVVGIVALIVGMVPALSGSALKGIRIFGKGMLEGLDSIVINWILPIIAAGMALGITYGMKKMDKERLFVDTNKMESASLFSHWEVALKWYIPILVVVALVFQVFGLFQ